MKMIKTAVASLNQTPLDWRGNIKNIASAIEAARAEEVSVLCLPELCLTGYGCEDAFFSPAVQERALSALTEVAPLTSGIIAALGLPVFFKNGLFSAACVLVDGKICGFVAKKSLAGEGIHYEPRWFKPWPKGFRGEIEIDGSAYPIGDVFFEIHELKLGFEICEDAWAADRPGADLAAEGVDLILNPSASHFSFGKAEIRRRFVLEGSRAFGATYLYANLLGNEAGRAIYDGGSMIAAQGEIIAATARFSFADFQLAAAVVDLDAGRGSRSRAHWLNGVDQQSNYRAVKVDFKPKECPPVIRLSETSPWEQLPALKEEEFSRAVSLGLFDYLRKSGSKGFVVSLSGGADSSSIACLVYLMLRLGLGELGEQRFREKAGTSSLKVELKDLLTCVYQGSENSTETTRAAAEGLARALGARYLEFNIGPIVSAYQAIVAQGLGRSLSWETDDIALQNIQARVRGPSVWMVANLKNALLLATSNRSEAAVGYTTMDGDTCGSISPIAGIDKAFIRQWLRWLEAEGPYGLGPIRELKLVNDQEPTAELRPPASKQTDEADLMPYEVLDRIERMAIRDKRSPMEVFELLTAEPGPYSAQQLGFWVQRFFRLWCRNQWKRERYAPCFHLDDENLDPKTWCRFPILSGGYALELEELRRRLEQIGTS